MSDRVLWDELEPVASKWDCVWNDREKLEWAKQAWGFITDAGLAGYSSPLGRAKVVIRFVALAEIFADFYEIAFSDGFKPDHLYIATELELTPFRLGQLGGSDPEWDNDDDDLDSLLHSLVGSARKEVYIALVSGFGHLPALFISLWKTNLIYMDDYDDGDDDDLDNNIVSSNLTPEKLQAYEWLTEGCYPWG